MATTSWKYIPIGESGRPVRVLNFAGGGFDTIMQLGVAHALLVIQGRAPDAIVGASAGAVQAAAVAEILQAGEDIAVDRDQDDEQKARCYQRRRAARVERFRDMVRAAQRAPEELIDASLPDAYQIDSHHPLQPLRTARFPEQERNERERHLRVRSGLIALYNELLGVHLPVGTITRIVRRWLGLNAAEEIPNPWAKRMVQGLEAFRIWLLVGAELHRMVTVMRVLLRPLFLTKTHARVATAGSLIFQFRTLRFLGLSVLYSLVLFVLAGTWVTISTLPAVIAFWLLSPAGQCSHYWLIVSVLAYLLPLGMMVLQVVRKHDAVTWFGALSDGLRGLAQFAISVFIWGGLPFIAIRLWRDRSGWSNLCPTDGDFYAGSVFLIGTGVACLIIAWSWLLFRYDRSRQRIEGKPKVSFMQWYGKRFLQSYSLSRSLLHHYGLERFLADLFDSEYYGPVDRAKDLENSLEEPAMTAAPPGEPGKCFEEAKAKKIGDYSSPCRNPRIALGLAVADVASGKVDVMDENAPVVCGLRAATAWTPLFPAVRYKGRLFIDSMNVSPVPMPALLSLLRRHGVNKDSTVIHVYRVAPVPFSRPRLSQVREPKPFLNLIDIAYRAMRLREFRDADLERRLTERYSQVIPAGAAAVPYAQGGRESYRMWVAPVELELPVGLNARIMFANRTERRTEILKTIAQGCRAALEVMIADAVKEARGDVQVSMTVPCATAVQHHLMHGVDERVAKTFGRKPLPGSQAAMECDSSGKPQPPPGLCEICEHCALGDESAAVPGSVRRQALVWKKWTNTATSWPHEFEAEQSDASDRHFAGAEKPFSRQQLPRVIDALGRYWPRERCDVGSEDRPTNRPLVSVLFSGGVFRGVFQVGVVSALSILRVKPDIVAGASVGSITAGMAAQLLCVTDSEHERREQLARLAAVYLAVDRVILTDRFADFVREFTIRAAGTRFSLRQADQLFRKYDQPWLVNFDKGAREVVGGIERLFYINPYQLKQLVKAARYRQGRRAARLGRQFAQQWLDRMNVGEEVLGAEALKDLIEYFIPSVDHVAQLTRDADDATTLHGTFAPFLSKGVILLATATDLTKGQLLTLGDPFQAPEEMSRADLTNSLLASSAFPGVFRPRWAPEVLPDTHQSDQLIDGGVMDNLPIDAVLNVMWSASSVDPGEGLVVRRPTSAAGVPTPHLVFAASLEPQLEDITHDDALTALETYWPALRARAKQLGYNAKLDNYRAAAQEISSLYDQFSGCGNGPAPHVPLSLEILALKPRWLCHTFAFHPMLGYRRVKQAESIAHGCALTLLKFKEYAEDKEAWLDAWGIERSELPVATTLEEARERLNTHKPNTGACWLREGRRCPFSRAALEELNSQLESEKRLLTETIKEISYIHTCCQNRTTHEAH